MYYALIIFEIGIPGARTLKDKRRVTSSVMTKLKNRFNVALAEDRENEKCELSKIYLLTLNTSKNELDSTVYKIENFLENLPDAVLLSFETDKELISEEIFWCLRDLKL